MKALFKPAQKEQCLDNRKLQNRKAHSGGVQSAFATYFQEQKTVKLGTGNFNR
jgi:hypothetical protein